MLRMVYASRKADPLLLKQIDINGDGEVSMEELQQTVEEDNSVLAPAFQLQRMLRQRILGVQVLGAGNSRGRRRISRVMIQEPPRPGTPSATSWPSSIGNGWRKKSASAASRRWRRNSAARRSCRKN